MSTVCSPPVVYHDFYITLVLGLDSQLLWGVYHVLFCKCRQLVIIGHKKSIKRTGINAQAAKDALAVINLRHNTFLVLFPLLINFDHPYGFRNALARDCAQLATSTFIMKEDVSSSVASNADASFGIKLITISNKF